MSFGLGRRRRAWDDGAGTVSHYRDRAHDLYDKGRRRGTDVYDHGREVAVDTYDRSRRRTADVYGEGRRRAGGAVDALAGRRTRSTGPVATAAILGVLAGAVVVAGAIRLLRRGAAPTAAVREPTADRIDDLAAGDGGATAPTSNLARPAGVAPGAAGNTVK